MILSVVSVFDSAAGAYNRPFHVPSTGLAVRSFRDEVNRKAEDNTMYNHPGDYTLELLGTFDDSSGLLTPCQVTTLARAIDLKE